MKIKELLKNIKPLEIVGDVDVDITGVNIDSRRIENGHLFVAMKGTQVDGHKFIGKAIELGAKAVLCEDMPTEKSENVTYIKVASTEECRTCCNSILWRAVEEAQACWCNRYQW